ncbi:hypothetical protein D3C71_1887890 [compost metagenome]
MGHWRVRLAVGADGPPGRVDDEAQVKVRRREPEIFVGLRAEAIEQVRMLLQRALEHLVDKALHQGDRHAVDDKG